MSCCESDDLAEELLIHLAQDVRGENGELIRAFGIVEPVDDVFKRFIVDRDVRGELVRFLVAVLFSLEMEQPGIVPVIRLAEELHEPLIYIGAVQLHLEPAVFLDAPVLADAQEHDAVDGALDCEVQFALGEVLDF